MWGVRVGEFLWGDLNRFRGGDLLHLDHLHLLLLAAAHAERYQRISVSSHKSAGKWRAETSRRPCIVATWATLSPKWPNVVDSCELTETIGRDLLHVDHLLLLLLAAPHAHRDDRAEEHHCGTLLNLRTNAERSVSEESSY